MPAVRSPEGATARDVKTEHLYPDLADKGYDEPDFRQPSKPVLYSVEEDKFRPTGKYNW